MSDDRISILTTAKAARAMGIGEQTLRDWSATDATLSGCIIRQTRRSTWWSVERLRARGYLIGKQPIPKQFQGESSLADDLVRLSELCLVVAAKLKSQANEERGSNGR